MNKTDLLLVNPSDRAGYGRVGKFSAIEPPLFAALISSYIREQGFNVNIIDANAENLSIEETVNRIVNLNPSLIGIIVLGQNPSASSTPKMVPTRELLNEIYNRKNKYQRTLIMGLHPSALPVKTLKEEKVDFLVNGEGFFTILELLKSKNNLNDNKLEGLYYRSKDGTIISNPPTKLINLDDLPIPAWDLLPMEKYRSHVWHYFSDSDHFSDLNNKSYYGVIYTSFGCPYNCSYCNIKSMYNNKSGIRYRSSEKVANDIDILAKYGIRKIKIIDELFTINEKRVIDICDLIIEKNYNPPLDIWCYARVDSITENMLKKMKTAGINWICYGFETANEEIRKGVNKKYGQDKIKETVKITKDCRINIIGNYIFGLPNDNYDSMRETLELAKELCCEWANFYTAIAYPGSQLYLELNNNIGSNNWENYNQYGPHSKPLSTKYLSSDQIREFRDIAFQEYYKNPTYLDMIKQKFNDNTVNIIKEIIKINIR